MRSSCSDCSSAGGGPPAAGAASCSRSTATAVSRAALMHSSPGTAATWQAACSSVARQEVRRSWGKVLAGSRTPCTGGWGFGGSTHQKAQSQGWLPLQASSCGEM